MNPRFHLKYIMTGPERTIVALDTRRTRDLLLWAEWFQKADRSIARTEIHECVISTVFLSIDHGFYDEGPPVLFETMVFACAEDYGSDTYMERYTSVAEAQEGHKRIVEHVRKHAQEAEATAEKIIKHLCARRPEEC